MVTDEALAVGDDSLFPLEAALGYDIAQNLFVGPDNLLVEGTSDYAYLTVLSDHLKEKGRTHVEDRWRILPAGGATNIPTFVALIGRSLEVSVLIDGSPSGVTKLKNLADRGLLDQKRLLLTDTFTDGVAPSDVEDLFDVADYLKLYNAAFGTKIKPAELNGTDRVIARTSRATGTSFADHGRPADVLLRQRGKLVSALSEVTLGGSRSSSRPSTRRSADACMSGQAVVAARQAGLDQGVPLTVVCGMVNPRPGSCDLQR